MLQNFAERLLLSPVESICPSPYTFHYEVFGSGSLEQDGPLSIVTVKKEEQASFMHDHRLGKGQCHAHKTGQSLAQRIIPALDMGGFSGLFAHRNVLFLGNHCCVGGPEVREAMPLAIPLWNGFPQPLTRPFAPIPNRIRHHLPRLPTEGNPHPGVVGFFEHKRPQFIQFQDRGRGIFGVRGEQRGTQRGKLSYFFLIQLETVVRETPKVRVRPRKLLRS